MKKKEKKLTKTCITNTKLINEMNFSNFVSKLEHSILSHVDK